MPLPEPELPSHSLDYLDFLRCRHAFECNEHVALLAKVRTPPPIDHDKYPLARFRVILKLINEKDAVTTAKKKGRGRKWRAQLACKWFADLKDFCLGICDQEFDRVGLGEVALPHACRVYFTVRRELYRIQYAILAFRCHLEHARETAERALLAISRSLGMSCRILVLPIHADPQ